MPPLPGGDPTRQEENTEQDPTISRIEPVPPTKTDYIFAAHGYQSNQRIGPENSRAKQEQDAERANQGAQRSRLPPDPEQKAQEVFTQDRARQGTANDRERQREIQREN